MQMTVYWDFIHNFIHIGSGDHFVNGTACLTADRESNDHSLAYKLALAFQVLTSKSQMTLIINWPTNLESFTYCFLFKYISALHFLPQHTKSNTIKL